MSSTNRSARSRLFGGGGGKRIAANNVLISGEPSTSNRQSPFDRWVRQTVQNNRGEIIVYPRVDSFGARAAARSPDFVVRIGAAAIRDAESREERLSKIRVD